jgi:putative inorganic carbon (hco3(-)) transporter
VAAIIAGWVAATQPLPVVVALLSLVTVALLSLMTPLAALMFLLVLAPLRTLIATESGIQFPLDIGQILLLAVLAVWVIHRLLDRRALLPLPRTALYAPLLIFLIAAGASALNALSLSAWIREWLKWVQMLVIVILVLTLVNRQQWWWLVLGLAAAGLANAFVGLYQFLGGSGALHLLINDRFFRAFGTFGQPNPFGGFMGLLAPLVGMYALGRLLRWWQWRSWQDLVQGASFAAAALGMIMGIGISWSRGAWLAFAVSIAVMVLALPQKLWQGMLLVGGLAGLLGVLWLTDTLPASVVVRLSSSTADFFALDDMRGVDITPANYPVVERLAHWQAALNMAQAEPWIGVGLGNYEVAYPHYRLLNWHEPLGHAHNYLLNILAETGLIGLLAYGKVWLIIILLNWRIRRHPDLLSRMCAIGILGTWSYLAVHSLFDNLYVNNLFLHIGLILGIQAVLYNQVSANVRLRPS